MAPDGQLRLFATISTPDPSINTVTTTTNTPNDDDDRGAAYGDKLIPEWRVNADDQVLLAGLAVVAAMLLAFGWSIWRGDDDADIAAVASTIASAVDDVANPDADVPLAAPVDGDDDEDGDGEDDGDTTATSSTSSTTSSTSSTTSTTTAEPTIGDVQAAVDPLAGDITGINDGTAAVLTGFVASQTESAEAEAAAAAVEGIESVDNQLVILEPEVVAALEEAGVTGPGAAGTGTEITVSGTIDTEDLRQPTLDAAAAVPGVTSIIDDRLEVSVTADLNQLPQVQFATGSATILEASNSDLDAAAELLSAVDPTTRIEVQGYTDVRGDDAANLELSQARADAVRDYLVGAGVDDNILSAVGYGETTQFAEGDTTEAYQANRLVRFQQVG